MRLAVSHLVQLDAPSVLEKVLAGQFRARTDAITEIEVFKWTFSKKKFRALSSGGAALQNAAFVVPS
jgi:hypothetical protein